MDVKINSSIKTKPLWSNRCTRAELKLLSALDQSSSQVFEEALKQLKMRALLDPKYPIIQELFKVHKYLKNWESALNGVYKHYFLFFTFKSALLHNFPQLSWWRYFWPKSEQLFLISTTFSKFWELFLKVYNFCKNFTISGTNITVLYEN